MSSSFIIYLIVGKILIFLGMKFAKDNGLNYGFMGRLLSCDLCYGVWMYFGLSFLWDVYVLPDILPHDLFSSFVTGIVCAFLVHVFSAGWRSLFSTIVIE